MRTDLLDKYEQEYFVSLFPRRITIIEECVSECRKAFGYDKLSHPMVVGNEKKDTVKSICKKHGLKFSFIKEILES